MWDKTPREFLLAIEGRRRGIEGRVEILAWHAAAIINHRTPAFGERQRKMVTVDDLLGRKKERRTFTSASELDEYMMQVARDVEDGV